MAGTSSEGTQLLALTLAHCTLVASGTVLVYDILCTLDQEAAHVWSNPRAFSSILFFLNRYSPLFDTFLSLALKFTNSLSPEDCRRLSGVVTYFVVLGTLISEAILVLRTYALWEQRRAILIALIMVALGLYVPAIVVTVFEVQSLRFTRNDTPIPGCHLTHASPIIFFAYVLLVVAETVMVILTAIQGWRYMRERTRSDWIVRLYKTGMLFYVYLLAISLANILVPLLAPRVFANSLAIPQRVIHSILCTRILLLIFKQRSGASTRRTLRTPQHNTPHDTHTSHPRQEPGIPTNDVGPRFDLNVLTTVGEEDVRFSTMYFEDMSRAGESSAGSDFEMSRMGGYGILG